MDNSDELDYEASYLRHFGAGCYILRHIDHIHFLVEHGCVIVDVIDVDGHVHHG